MILFLSGYRGSGKSTIATLVAARLGCPSVDTDRQIEIETGKSIAEIFATDGEPVFRDLESDVIRRLVSENSDSASDIVIALGGGALIRTDNRQLVRTGKNVWLRADAEVLWGRISADPATPAQRPDLSERGGLAEIQSVLASRFATYEECADYSINTGELSAREAVVAVVRWWESVDKT